MKIDKIKKMSNGKYKIDLDNNEKITLYDDVILKNNVLFKSEIDSDFLNKLNVENSKYDIYNKVIKYISKKMRSEFEIKNYLKKHFIENVEEVITRLKECNLINDLLYVKAFITDQINLTNNGPFKIKKDLLQHEIDENVIEEELQKYDEQIFLNKIKKIVDKKLKSNNKSEKVFKLKLKMDLYNLGYDNGMIDNIISNYHFNVSTITKEYDKLFKKLNLKYSNEELLNQIKKKLYTKGFTISEINEEIKKRVD